MWHAILLLGIGFVAGVIVTLLVIESEVAQAIGGALW